MMSELGEFKSPGLQTNEFLRQESHNYDANGCEMPEDSGLNLVGIP